MPVKKVIKKKQIKAKEGRPTDYKPEYVEQVYKLCLLGATDKEIADFFNVCTSTLANWKNIHPEFMDSLKKSKLLADGDVAESLYNRALGYSHPDEHISNFQGEITKTKITKHYAPDPTSAIFWLKNRQPNKWRDKQVVNISLDEEFAKDESMLDKLTGRNDKTV